MELEDGLDDVVHREALLQHLAERVPRRLLHRVGVDLVGGGLQVLLEERQHVLLEAVLEDREDAVFRRGPGAQHADGGGLHVLDGRDGLRDEVVVVFERRQLRRGGAAGERGEDLADGLRRHAAVRVEPDEHVAVAPRAGVGDHARRVFAGRLRGIDHVRQSLYPLLERGVVLRGALPDLERLRGEVHLAVVLLVEDARLLVEDVLQVLLVALEEHLVGADRLGVGVDAVVQAVAEADHLVDALLGKERVAVHLGRLLPDAVHAARALDEADDGPGEVVVHHDVGVLQVLALRQHVRRHHHARLALERDRRHVVGDGREAVHLADDVVRRAVHLGDVRDAARLELFGDVAGGVGVLREHEHLLVPVLPRDEAFEGVQLLVLGRTPLAALGEHVHDDPVVLPQRGGERLLEVRRADPLHRGGGVRHEVVVGVLAGLRVHGRLGRDGEQRLAGRVLVLVDPVADVGVGRAHRQVETFLDRVEVHGVAHGVAVERHEEGHAAGVHALVEAAAAEPHHALARAREVVENLLLLRGGGFRRLGVDVLLEAVTRKRELAHPIDHLLAVEALEHVAGRRAELERLGDAVGEVVQRAVPHLQVLASVVLVGEGVVLLDERARAAHEVELHQVAPVVGEEALLEGADRPRRHAAVLDRERLLAAFRRDLLLRADAQVLVGVDEELELVGEVGEVLVVGRGGEEQNLVALIGQQVLDPRVALSVAVPEVVAFVHDHQLEEALLARVELVGDGPDAHLEVVLVGVGPPHRLQVRRTDHERGGAHDLLVVLRHGACGDRLAEAHHVADHRAAALLQVAHGEFHCRLLEVEQLLVERRRQVVFRDALPRLAAEVVHDLQVHLVGRRPLDGRPAFVEDLDEVLRDVDRIGVVPPAVEPLGVLRVVVEVAELGVQLAVAEHAAEREVTAAHDRHDRVRRVLRTVRQIQLRVERVAEMELHAHLALDELAAKGLERLLVRRRRDAQGQLAAEAVGHPLAPPARGLRVDRLPLDGVHLLDDFLLGTLHADQETADAPDGRDHAVGPLFKRLAPGQALDVVCDKLPASQVEVPHANVGALHADVRENRVKPVLELRFDVVEDLRHC